MMNDELEEVEEEREEEHEHVDDDQEAPDAAGQVGQQVLDPLAAVHAVEHDRKQARRSG